MYSQLNRFAFLLYHGRKSKAIISQLHTFTCEKVIIQEYFRVQCTN